MNDDYLVDFDEPVEGEEQLLPCPFCGFHAKLDYKDWSLWYVKCTGCGVSSALYRKKDLAILRWNRRVG